eukprot:TRINITY_DN50736_c0_g1_i1.p1 TRINITY_DN50736_c0_g1~~TRINITY_DN50736_c0_g1_i1.p1  ORF type:complete len:350 (+),score=124.45 TRINITY_DN50736_c0_g1_i1:81-1052(+)
MGRHEHYDVLGIARPDDAQGEDIAKAFRQMALRHHPELNKETTNLQECKERFRQIAEAYEVLSNPRLRAVYDEHGSEGLHEGVAGVPPYRFSGDPAAVFKAFFGVPNPFQMIGDMSAADGTQHEFFSEVAALPRVPPQLPAKELSVDCTLEELYVGATKQLTLLNDHVDKGGAVVSKQRETLVWHIPPGAPPKMRVTFAKKGSTGDMHTPGDVHAVLNQLPNSRFQREGDDLVYTHSVDLKDALCGFTVEIQTLDGRTLRVFVDEVVHPRYVKRVAGEGMPVMGAPGTRGSMRIRFQTRFPSFLDAEQRKQLRRILQCPQADA